MGSVYIALYSKRETELVMHCILTKYSDCKLFFFNFNHIILEKLQEIYQVKSIEVISNNFDNSFPVYHIHICKLTSYYTPCFGCRGCFVSVVAVYKILKIQWCEKLIIMTIRLGTFLKMGNLLQYTESKKCYFVLWYKTFQRVWFTECDYIVIITMFPNFIYIYMHNILL